MKFFYIIFFLIFLPTIVSAKTTQFYCEGEWQWKWNRGQETDFVLEPHERDGILTLDIKNKKMIWKEINTNDYSIEAPMVDYDWEDKNYFYSFAKNYWGYTFSRYTGRFTMIYSQSYFHKIRYQCTKNPKKII